MDIPRIVIAGIKSKVGKTMISIGLMRALTNRGYKVQPFKVGPDFIDPGFHNIATGRKSRNIDSFMMDSYSIIETFERNCKGADIAIIEGKTGLFDSHDAIDERGSTAHIAKILRSPVILVADVERMSRTAAAMIYGYKEFDKYVNIEGVILNRIGNPRHLKRVVLAVEKLSGVRVIGAIPRENIDMPYRHLGLIPAHERQEYEMLFDRLADIVEKNVDVDRIIEISCNAESLEDVKPNPLFIPAEKRVGVAGVIQDKPFSFYYEDNLDALSARGIELKYIDSLNDKKLPEIDFLYIGGGFPEVFVEELEKNDSLRKDIYEFCDDNNPVYAECGGLMYLGESIITDGEYEMVGFLTFKTEMNRKFHALGYTVCEVAKDTFAFDRGDQIKGHEFHYSRVIPSRKLDFAFKVLRGKGINGEFDGVIKKSTLACYQHLNVLSYPKFVFKIASAIKTKNTVF
ncbi:hydrogenobyrinic acid a,c-diamide synthase (glutamine-hydrolysing) /cobyrinate a,c-diamide synthase [Archaeoglobus sulfaticallidus PM70-1]|uniref:Cobyrinate a,c-diamide synthase n=1 Tax=Archaeoglobus sulfaticallidus PM70-1 TaxID=387631 RepID=N0BNQ5_9EURY|nr:cobyrinate a,c-diamide synthase [Archaeoglobus sulfaticallidus]AGK61960.1 hydrogenobyrinic acid a,c-diamide synthase (glutamine-hydrolysing) /cobyrinate a,c-diamide synthase [Archaeoglobus sulfaticallidus PM70-1]